MTQSYKYLGCHFNLNLNWKKDQNLTITNLINKINIIKNRIVSPDLKVQIINEIIYPIWEYHANFYIFDKKNRKKVSAICRKLARSWYGLSKKVPNEFLWLKQEHGGINIKNVNAMNFACFMSNYVDKCINASNSLTKHTAEIMCINSKYLRDNNNHLMEIEFNSTPNTHIKQFINYRIGTVQCFAKLIKKFNSSIHSNYSNKNRLDYILPTRTFNAIQKTCINKLGSTKCDNFTDDFGFLKFDVSDILTKIQLQKLKPHICEPNSYKIKQQIGKIYDRATTIFNIPIINYNTFPQDINFINGEIWVWSDGSGINRKFGWGVWFKDNSPLNNNGRTYLLHTVFEGELMAIEYIIQLIPKTFNLRIFVDCKSAIDVIQTIENFKDLSYQAMRKVENRYIIRRIIQAIKEKKQNFGAKVYLQKVRSHYKQKMDNYKTQDIQKYIKINQEMHDLKLKYPQHFKLILKGNDKADLLAKNSLNLAIKKVKFCKGMDRYTIFTKTLSQNNNLLIHPIVSTIRSYVLNIYNIKHKKKWDTKSNIRWKHNSIAISSYNLIKEKKIALYPFIIKKFFLRFLNNDLPTQYNMYKKTKSQTIAKFKITPRQQYKLQIYKKKCNICSEKADILHITSKCKINSQLQNEKIKAIQKILDIKLGKNKIDITNFLIDSKFNNLNRTNILNRKNYNNMGLITKKFQMQIHKITKNKFQTLNISRHIQLIILGWSYLMYKNYLKKFFTSLKKNGRYIAKYHNYGSVT